MHVFSITSNKLIKVIRQYSTNLIDIWLQVIKKSYIQIKESNNILPKV